MMQWNETNLLLALAAEVALWSWNVDTDKIMLAKRGCDLWGVPENQVPDLRGLILAHAPP